MATAKRPSGYLLTGNFTETGGPAYRDASQRWVREASSAALFTTEAEAKAEADRARAAEQRVVSDPYVCEVALTEAGGFEFKSARERIRAGGPTTPVRRPDRS